MPTNGATEPIVLTVPSIGRPSLNALAALTALYAVVAPPTTLGAIAKAGAFSKIALGAFFNCSKAFAFAIALIGNLGSGATLGTKDCSETVVGKMIRELPGT